MAGTPSLSDLLSQGSAAANAAVAFASSLTAPYTSSLQWSTVTLWALACVGALSLGTLLLPWLLSFFTCIPQDLRARYGAQWALVTGGSSGIGRALARDLARQGLHIVVAAVPDAALAALPAEFARDFPGIQVRTVGVNLSSPHVEEYMEPLAAATRDIVVQLVYLNAGYMVTGFFTATPLPAWLANLNCNLTAPIAAAHHFTRRMKEAGVRGAVFFTSSPANVIPSPFSTLYGASKSALTHFATSLACEVAEDGIHVSVIHPSPVATAFYTGAHALPTLQMFKSTAVGPEGVADVMIRATGRSVIVDQGYYPIAFKLLLRIIDFTFLAELLALIAPWQGDYIALKKQTAAAAAAAASKAAVAAAAAAVPAVTAVEDVEEEEEEVAPVRTARKRRASMAAVRK